MKNRNSTLSRRHYSRYILAVLIVYVILTQFVPAMGRFYFYVMYPAISQVLTTLSSPIPFSVGDVFIFLSLIGLIVIPIYCRWRFRTKWKTLLARDVRYLLWIYVWFYLAWGLNYSQPRLFSRLHIQPARYDKSLLQLFAQRYIDSLNKAYVVSPLDIDKERVHREVTRIYRAISDSLAVHTPQSDRLRVKTMLFSNFISSVGVTGYMGPFFGEFNLNDNLLSVAYPATYAHEMAHLLGISSEAEANFYAYQVCTRSHDSWIRFSGYFFIMGYVMSNARMVLDDRQFDNLKNRIRPEVKRLYHYQHCYWRALYSPLLGSIQDWIYELYLKGNKIENGQQNYFQVVGLLISYEQYLNKK